MQRLRATKLFKVSLLIIFFGLLIFLNPNKVTAPFRSLFLAILSPFEKITYTATIFGQGAVEVVASLGQLKNENQALLKENQQLLAQRAKLEDVQNENDELRKQLNLLPRDKFDLLSANVIGQSSDAMGNWLEIDKGSADGLQDDLPVIVANGILIGRLQQVASKNAKIVLLTNPKSIINVATTQTGARGVAKGEYGLGIVFDMILQTDEIRDGDEVVTAGSGGLMPRGLLVGTVQSLHRADDNLFRQATIVSPVQVSKLQFVFVILSRK